MLPNNYRAEASILSTSDQSNVCITATTGYGIRETKARFKVIFPVPYYFGLWSDTHSVKPNPNPKKGVLWIYKSSISSIQRDVPQAASQFFTDFLVISSETKSNGSFCLPARTKPNGSVAD